MTNWSEGGRPGGMIPIGTIVALLFGVPVGGFGIFFFLSITVSLESSETWNPIVALRTLHSTAMNPVLWILSPSSSEAATQGMMAMIGTVTGSVGAAVMVGKKKYRQHRALTDAGTRDPRMLGIDLRWHTSDTPGTNSSDSRALRGLSPPRNNTTYVLARDPGRYESPGRMIPSIRDIAGCCSPSTMRRLAEHLVLKTPPRGYLRGGRTDILPISLPLEYYK